MAGKNLPMRIPMIRSASFNIFHGKGLVNLGLKIDSGGVKLLEYSLYFTFIVIPIAVFLLLFQTKFLTLRKGIDAARYYKKSMVEDPWKNLSKSRNKKAQEQEDERIPSRPA